MLQSNQVLSFFRSRNVNGGWSQQELAEFYRVECALINSGVSISTDSGFTDEGDPWFVFLRQDSEEIIVHFARIDGEFVVASNLASDIVRGRNFNALVRDLLETHSYILPKADSRRQTVFLHPAALLAALVTTGYFKSAEMNLAAHDADRLTEKGSGWHFSKQELLGYSAIVMAAVWDGLTAIDDGNAKVTDFAWLLNTSEGHNDASVDHSTSLLAQFDDVVWAGDHNGVFNFIHREDVPARNFEGPDVNIVTDGRGAPVSTGGIEHWAQLDLTHPTVSEDAVSTGLPQVARVSDGGFVDEHPDVKLPFGIELLPGKEGTQSTHPTADASVSPVGSSSPPETNHLPTSDFSADTAALAVVSNALHLSSSTVHPVELVASSLSDAIDAAFSQLSHANDLDLGTSGSTDQVISVASQTTTTPTGPSAEAVSMPIAKPFDAVAQHELDEFLANTPNYKLESYGHNLLLVDTSPAHFSTTHFEIETWLMSDGSTLSIVGSAHPHDALAA